MGGGGGEGDGAGSWAFAGGQAIRVIVRAGDGDVDGVGVRPGGVDPKDDLRNGAVSLKRDHAGAGDKLLLISGATAVQSAVAVAGLTRRSYPETQPGEAAPHPVRATATTPRAEHRAAGLMHGSAAEGDVRCRRGADRFAKRGTQMLCVLSKTVAYWQVSWTLVGLELVVSLELPAMPETVRVTGPPVGPRQVARPLVLSFVLEMEMWIGSGLVHLDGITAMTLEMAQAREELGAST